MITKQEVSMRQHTFKMALTLAVLFVLTFSLQPAQADTNWNDFSANLEKALKTDNLGLQQSAMRLVIKYGDKVNVNNAMSNVLELYLFNQDKEVRELALLTIYRMDSKKAIQLLDIRSGEDFNTVFNEKLDKYLSAQ